jgi:Fur family ferric uptake transcriptional regulator
MSVPRLSPPLPTADAESATEAMRGRGMRITAARRLVVEALHEAGRPVTAEELASGMYGRFPRTDLASVYRNLETLEDAGIVQHMHLGHGPGLYAPTGSAHEYVACERCGRSEPVPAAALDGLRAAVRAAVGYEASFTHFPLMGLCPICLDKRAARA